MRRVEGTNKFGKPYVGYFCPTPKGTPDQCKPVFDSAFKASPTNVRSSDTTSIQNTPQNANLGLTEAFQTSVLSRLEAIERMVGELITKNIPF